MTKYVDEDIIKRFKAKGEPFDHTKLVALLDGLNQSYKAKNPYLCAIAIRAILDHIPPMLGSSSFEMVVSNYPWPSTHKKYMESLLNFKNEGDDTLHTQISENKDFLKFEQITLLSNRLNILLQECLKKGGTQELSKAKELSKLKQNTPSSKINITLVEKPVSWQNYGVGFVMGYGFEFKLNIDNFNNSRPDYISASLKANSNEGVWISTNFIFESEKSIPNQPFRIEVGEEKQVTVVLSDGEFRHTPHEHRFRPNIDMDTMVLLVSTKSGKDFELSIKPSMII